MTAERTAPETDAALAAFQTELLRMLADGLTQEEIVRHLAAEPAFAPYADLARTIDPRSLGIAARVVKKYARRG